MQNIRFIIRFRGEFMRHVENEGETNKYAKNEDVGWGGFSVIVVVCASDAISMG